MDHFGIGSAVKGVVLTYFQTSRGTGRTVSLVESVKDGDRVIFSNTREAERVRRLCLERGVSVDCVVVNPNNPTDIFRHAPSPNGTRTLFDHSWVEQYYMQAIEHCQKGIEELQKTLSRNGSEETSRREWR